MESPLLERRSAGWLVLEWLPRLLVAGLFGYTGLTKILDIETFVKEVQAYQLIPGLWEQWSYLLAYVVPWLEVLTAALLLVGLWRREARLVLVIMLVAFTAAKSYVEALGREIDCGCVPVDSLMHFIFDGWIGVGTNVVLLCLLGVEAYAQRRRRRRARDRCEQSGAEPASANRP